jgi:amino-acid N-acetyltransferase
LGRALVQSLEQRARDEGVNELVLLTQTAQTFFEGAGYRVIERESAPPSVQSSEEFRSLCPQSACCMSKRLGEPVSGSES